MKNDKLIEAWNAAEPDAAADERMKTAVLAFSRSARKGKEQPAMTTKSKTMRQIWVPVAACLALAVALAAFFGTGFRSYRVKLDTGDTITYKRTSSAASQGSIDFGYPFAVTSRELAADELRAISPLLTDGFGDFRAASCCGWRARPVRRR